MSRTCVTLAFLALVACGSDDKKPADQNQKDPKAEKAPVAEEKGKEAGKKASKSRKGGAAEEAAPEEAGPPKVEFQETDFAETDRSRDPFRPYADIFILAAKDKIRSQLHVVAKEYSVDELKLVALVTRIHPSRAMFVDPTGKGHVVDHGDFVGKPEIVQGGTTTADYEIHWRVDQVREGDVVLIREDPANPDVPSATRVVPLRADESVR